MLEAQADSIAALVQAHLATLAEPNDALSLFGRERRIIRSLYERGLTKQTILDLFRVIHRMIDLPKELASQFMHEHYQWEGEKEMPFMLDFERETMERGEAKGLREGLLEAIKLGLKLRFGAEGLQCLPLIQPLTDIAMLRRILQALETAATPDDIRRLLS